MARSNGLPRRFAGSLVTAAGLLVVLGGVLAFGLMARSGAASDPAGQQTELLRLEAQRVSAERSYAVKRWYVGRVEADQASDLGFERSGLLRGIAVDEGDRVGAGEVVATLDDRRLLAERVTRVAERDEAAARLELERITVERLDVLKARQTVSGQEYREAKSELRVAEAALARAEAAIAEVDVGLDKRRLVAPFDGVVARRFRDNGQVVNPGEPVLRLLESSRPRVRIGVGPNELPELAVGASSSVEISGRRFPATVAAILPTRDARGRGVDVIFSIDSELGEIKEGDLARVGLEREVAAEGFWVGIRALAEGTRGLWSVYLLDGDRSEVATVRPVAVEVLHYEEDRAFVRGLVAHGSVIAADGLHRVAPGMAVRPVLARDLEQAAAALSKLSERSR
ncbi:MAG: efflux RND transporter periplasmic adaptor subunit [Planctomycetota bacterium]